MNNATFSHTQTLQNVVPRLTVGDCASGHRVENRSKNRDVIMLPRESVETIIYG